MSLAKRTAVTGVRKNAKGEVIAFNINRKNWGRGKRGGSLLDIRNLEDGSQQINMCCLGVYGRACGIGVKRLRGKGMPLDVRNLPKQMSWTIKKYMFGRDNSGAAISLAKTNDANKTSDKKKEATIIRRFAKQGIRVRFVGKG